MSYEVPLETPLLPATRRTHGLPPTRNPPRYDRSTKDNYTIAAEAAQGPDGPFGPQAFLGPFSASRSTRDHAYHGVYVASRQAVQDEVITHFLNSSADFLRVPQKVLQPTYTTKRR